MRYVHTCYRVLDLDRSIDFYTNKLGLELARKTPIGDDATNAAGGRLGEEQEDTEHGAQCSEPPGARPGAGPCCGPSSAWPAWP